MLNWFKAAKKEEFLTVKIMTDKSKLSDEELLRAVGRLTQNEEWALFEEQLRRLRDFHLRELVLAPDEKTADRLRGRIKALDLILTLKQ